MLLRPNDQQGPCTTVADVAKRLATTESVEDIVAVLRAHTRTIIGSDGVAVILREGERCHYVAEDAVEPLWLGQRYPLTACVSGWAMLNDRSLFITDIESDPRIPQEAYGRTSMRSLAMAPIGQPSPVAALGAYWCAFIEPDEGTMRHLDAIARLATEAFARVRPNRHVDALAS
jgi:L-methionine (R)-S-oxide reductase